MDPCLAQLALLLCLLSPSLASPYVIGANELLPSSPPFLFVFGASMVDSGTNAVAMPFRSRAEFDPYGSDYFGRPVGRWSNGRTFMDILTESLGLGFLDPFIQSYGSNFTHGINFASSGSTAHNTTVSSTTSSEGLFSLLVQVEQFREYQRAVLSSQQDHKEKSRLREQFSNAIYFFETAHNDYRQAGIDSDQAAVVNLVLVSMRQAFEVLYTLGARNFIVMNVTPLGCTPMVLSETIPMKKDEYNCSEAWNTFVSMHNTKLSELLDDLRSKYPSAEWIIFDAYNIFLDGYQNPAKYGIQYPFQACCGVRGPYNYNSEVRCGEVAKYVNGTYLEAEKCEDPDLHLIWDSIHPIESFAKYVAQGVLYGTHLTPNFDLLTRFQDVKVQ